jgi:ribosomal-protein-serine acetyltransferase
MIEPSSHLQNSRITLRFPRLEDLNPLYLISAENHERLNPFLAWASKPVSLQSVEKFIVSSVAARKQWWALHYLVWHGERLIGAVSAHSIDLSEKRCELGFWIDRDSEGRGLMKEALATLVSELFRVGMSKLVIRSSERNPRSAAVAKALGFHFVEIQAKARRDLDEWVDLLVFESRAEPVASASGEEGL